MILAFLFNLLFGAIVLDGVTGDQLSAVASFDANNVRVGDPLILTVEFVGSADFTALHPPELSREVDPSVWKVDDESARTETWEGYGRRLVYRVRPMKAGLLRFPALEFTYIGVSGKSSATVATREIPVHVKAGTQVALAGFYDDAEKLPMPDGIVVGAPAGLTEDRLFDWRKACGAPSADAFAKFDLPEARLNEAACAILDGNWARALKIYSRLEWTIGQTPAIERGIVAALARKTGDGNAELPFWRQVLRPVLRHTWKGRVGIALGVLGGIVLLLWLCRRLIRALAVVAVVVTLTSGTARAESPFDMIEKHIQEMQQMLNSAEGFHRQMTMSINGVEQPDIKITATLRTDRADIRQGEKFNFILALEAPKSCSFEQINARPSEMFGLVFLGQSFENLPDGVSANPSNVVKRMQVPVRYDVPFKGSVSFAVGGMVSARQSSARGFSMFSFSRSFQVETPAIELEIKPLPTDDQPADFSGAIGEGFALTRSVNANRVGTNDVITVINTLVYNGFVPPAAVPDLVERRPGRIRWREYFIADGTVGSIPEKTFSYYDTASRAYATARAKPIALMYIADTEADTAATVAVDARENEDGAALKLRFYPREAAPVIGVSTGPHTVTETRGQWARIDDGRRAGWVKKEDLR